MVGGQELGKRGGNQVASRKFVLDLAITMLFMAVRTIFLGSEEVQSTTRLVCTCDSPSVWSPGQHCQHHLGATVEVGPPTGGGRQALWRFLTDARVGDHSSTHGETVLELGVQVPLTSRPLSCFPSVSKCSLLGDGFEYTMCARLLAPCWEHRDE